ncbi:beta-lactamase family protein [Aquimarina sp. U1-2]|uniref:serine hydrolase domain-containing protein n=1 Tax=Aquimarina sp. U1-2 TaxID=2823141 RepID=UPI001AECC86C|nr:serine hydrolase domain-containing protein [Aquimarina sp. U1-2]MBP2830619.1 beta-lactamase family protein [Aquimarina sp. U1-2]
MRHTLFIIIFIHLLTGCNTSEKKRKKETVATVKLLVTKHADSLLEDPKINAVSIGIYKNGKKYTSHHGVLDKGQGNSPTDSTIYEIASVSKTFAGVLVANAVIEGKIKLEDDIRTYLKQDFDNFEYKRHPIRIKHLLTHTSRMSKFLPERINALFSDFNEELPFKVHEIQKSYSKQEFLSDLSQLKIDTIPGVKYKYSNADTELMAQILENVYQKPFDSILTSYFNDHVDMKNTHIHLSKNKMHHLANGYGMTGKMVPHEAVLYGADGGVKTTLPDMVNYIEFQLDLSNPTVLESHRVLYVNNSRKMAYYLPVKMHKEYGVYYSMHGGSFGTQNWLFILPEHDMGITIVTNQSDLDTANKLAHTVKALLQELM